MAGGRKPDYDIMSWNKTTGEKGKVGAAWKNDNGSISLRLNPFVALTQAPDQYFTLFINDGKGPTTQPAPTSGLRRDEMDDEIPF